MQTKRSIKMFTPGQNIIYLVNKIAAQNLYTEEINKQKPCKIHSSFVLNHHCIGTTNWKTIIITREIKRRREKARPRN